MTDKQFDPRYDPIFQRGHEDSVVRPRAMAEPPPVERVPTQQSAVPVREPAREEPASSSSSQAADAELTRPVVTTEILGEQPVNRRRVPNPFIVLLWLAGPALVALGTVSNYRFFASQFSGPVRQDDVVLQQLVWALSPSAVTVGLAIIAGLLFWHAFRWQSRRAHAPDDAAAR